MANNTQEHWSKFHDGKYKSLYNYIKTLNLKNNDNLTSENYILVLINDLNGIIINNKNWSLSSKESALSVVFKWLSIHNTCDENIKYIEYYRQEYDKMKSLRDYDRGENKQDKKEQVNYKNINYFKNILENTHIENLSKSDHMKYLLLSMLVHQPPLRTSFYSSVMFLTNRNENNNKDNYLLIENDKIYYIVNIDKVSYCNSNNYYIDIDNPILKKIILYSYNKYDRKYVFVNIKNKNTSSNNIAIWLKDFTGTKININMLRSSYINDKYTTILTYNEKKKLADQMRHSVQSALLDYVKNDV